MSYTIYADDVPVSTYGSLWDYMQVADLLDSITLKPTPKPESPEELPGLTDEAKAIIYNKEN